MTHIVQRGSDYQLDYNWVSERSEGDFP